MRRPWNNAEKSVVRAAYEGANSQRSLGLSDLAIALGRDKTEVCRMARKMGLTNTTRTLRDEGPKQRSNKFIDDKSRRESIGQATKKRIAENGHPRGMSGKTHDPKTKERLSKIGRERWASMDAKEREELIIASTSASIKSRSGPPKTKRGSWAAGWREVGSKRIYFRSRWEANYAHYLQWLLDNGQISDWEYEPKTFWFEAIRRGVRSYKPDFLVTENNGSTAWHEVKGWMDARSRTTLKRMAKYHPNEKIILIDGPVYRSIRLKVVGLIPEWEDSKRDSYA